MGLAVNMTLLLLVLVLEHDCAYYRLLPRGRGRQLEYPSILDQDLDQDFGFFHPHTTLDHGLGLKERKYESSYSLWNNQLVYYKGSDEISLADAVEICGSMNGRLPSVHSKQDTESIEEIMGHDARVWLGAKNHSSLREDFQWMDGTPWDYDLFPTTDHRTPCKTHCCGIGYTTIAPYETGFVIKDCQDKRRMICLIDDITHMLDQMFPDDNGLSETLQRHEDKLTFLTSFNMDSRQMEINFINAYSDHLTRTIIMAQDKVIELSRYTQQVNHDQTGMSAQLDHKLQELITHCNNLQLSLNQTDRILAQSLSKSIKSPLHQPADLVTRVHDQIRANADSTRRCILLLIGNIMILGIELGYTVFRSNLPRASFDFTRRMFSL